MTANRPDAVRLVVSSHQAAKAPDARAASIKTLECPHHDYLAEFSERTDHLVDATPAWFAACTSGIEDIYKIYAESFHGVDHLHRIQEETRAIVIDDIAAKL